MQTFWPSVKRPTQYNGPSRPAHLTTIGGTTPSIVDTGLSAGAATETRMPVEGKIVGAVTAAVGNAEPV